MKKYSCVFYIIDINHNKKKIKNISYILEENISCYFFNIKFLHTHSILTIKRLLTRCLEICKNKKLEKIMGDIINICDKLFKKYLKNNNKILDCRMFIIGCGIIPLKRIILKIDSNFSYDDIRTSILFDEVEYFSDGEYMCTKYNTTKYVGKDIIDGMSCIIYENGKRYVVQNNIETSDETYADVLKKCSF